jgi:transcriptional regulator with XRE-family HTH domain
MSDSLNELPQTVRNVRYLLRQAGVPTEKWVRHLAKCATLEESEASEIIHGRKPTRQEAEAIAAAFAQDSETLQSAPLYGLGEWTILRENLRFLLNSLEDHTQKALASELDKSEEAVSRWVNQGTTPHAKTLSALLSCFGLPADLDLKSEPLFLATTPVGGFAQKKWILDYVRRMPPEEITPVFEAIRRILLRGEKN